MTLILLKWVIWDGLIMISKLGISSYFLSVCTSHLLQEAED